MAKPKTEQEKKKEYLRKYKQADIAVKIKELEIQALKEEQTSPSVKYSDMPKGYKKSDLSDYIVELNKLYDQLEKKKLKRIRMCSEIVEKIEKMKDEREKNILNLRYICGKEWEEIAVLMNYSSRSVHRIHGEALKNFKLS